MKKINLKTILLTFFLIIYIVFDYKYIIPNNNYILNIIIWILLVLISFIFVGSLSYRRRTKVDTIQTILIVQIIYLIISYLLSIVLGTTENIIDLSNIINIAILLCIEITRYSLVRNSAIKYYPLIVILFSIITYINLPSSILLSIIPIILQNIILTYLSYSVGFIPSLIYTLLNNIIYIIPLKPNIGIYTSIVLNTITNIILLMNLRKINKNDLSNRKIKKSNYYILIIFIPLILMFTGIGKYKLIGIVSNSMSPTFNRGSGVIYKNDSNPSIGDIIVYEDNNQYIVHRVISIENDLIVTKGDNNDLPDKSISKSKIKGIVKHYIPYIGYPFVLIKELFNK